MDVALVIAVLVVITYYAGELVWRERVLRVDQQIVVVDGSISEGDRYSANLLAQVRRWITDEETLIELTVDERPAAVIVDPYHNFIERNLDDNVKRL